MSGGSGTPALTDTEGSALLVGSGTALGTGVSPPNSVLVGLALFLTFFVMSPVFNQIYTQAYQPLVDQVRHDSDLRLCGAGAPPCPGGED